MHEALNRASIGRAPVRLGTNSGVRARTCALRDTVPQNGWNSEASYVLCFIVEGGHSPYVTG